MTPDGGALKVQCSRQKWRWVNSANRLWRPEGGFASAYPAKWSTTRPCAHRPPAVDRGCRRGVAVTFNHPGQFERGSPQPPERISRWRWSVMTEVHVAAPNATRKPGSGQRSPTDRGTRPVRRFLFDSTSNSVCRFVEDCRVIFVERAINLNSLSGGAGLITHPCPTAGRRFIRSAAT